MSVPMDPREQKLSRTSGPKFIHSFYWTVFRGKQVRILFTHLHFIFIFLEGVKAGQFSILQLVDALG